MDLRTIVELSHEFGTPDYVQGGGGNSSAKDAETLWVKPSGTTLADLAVESLMPMNRARIEAIARLPLPEGVQERERCVAQALLDAVRGDATRRPTVEAMLHNAFDAALVVHTHPALVNGMTCARDGRAACGRLFPDALWVEYTDPGFRLSLVVTERLRAERSARGVEPQLVFLENHGVFVAGPTADAVRDAYAGMLATLRAEYARAGVSIAVAEEPAPSAGVRAAIQARLVEAFGAGRPVCVAAAGRFAIHRGPLTPDHCVFMKTHALIGTPTPEAVRAYVAANGYEPRVVAAQEGIFGIGRTERDAALSLAVARDGALVVHLASAFGGVRYMSDEARRFIENWEMERYREKVAAG